MSTLKSLLGVYNHECSGCGLSEGVRSICVRGRGGFADKILFVAEAPGEQEDKAGVALVGKAGQVFNKILASIGMTEDDYYCTNVVKCRPPGNRTPSAHEVHSCRRYLLREIVNLKPRFIVLLGKTAICSFFGKSATVKAYRGKVHEYGGYKVFCTLHPSSVNYDPYNYNLIVDDLNILVRHLNGTFKPTKANYECITRGPIPTDYIRSLARKERFALDVETTGLDMYDPDFRILSVAFSDVVREGHGVLLDHRKSPFDGDDIIQELDKSVILSRQPIIIGHNLKFDLLCLRTKGVYYRGPVRDTMVMAHLLDENNPDKSLESLALRDTEMGNIKEETKEEFKKGNMEKIPVEVLLTRNCRDTDATLRLHDKYLKEIEAQGMKPLMDFQMKALQMLVDVEWEGWAIHKENYLRLKKEYKAKIKEKRDWIYQYSGEINLNSTQQKAKFLYEDLGIEPLPKEKGGKTKGGDDSTAKDVLKQLLWELKGKRRAIVEAIIEYSTLTKRYTFFDQIKTNLKIDGKVHASYKQTKLEWGEENELGGTVTGRLSCKKPNIQQIPRDGDIKNIFRSKWRNGRIVQLDYSQMELRILAEISGDRKMCGIFADDEIDIHRRVASWPAVYNKPESEITEQERKFTKQVNFGISYMIGPQGLARKLSEVAGHIVTEDESKRLIKGWFKEFPQVETFIDDTRRELIRYGEVTTLMGRKRHLADTNPGTAKGREGIRQGVNFLIQSLASDITIFRAVQFWEWLIEQGMKTRIVGFVHDSVVADSPEGEVMKVAKAMKRIFEDGDFEEEFGFRMKVPLKIEIKEGPTWGELKVLEV
jgi:DNA polymerase-1